MALTDKEEKTLKKVRALYEHSSTPQGIKDNAKVVIERLEKKIDKDSVYPNRTYKHSHYGFFEVNAKCWGEETNETKQQRKSAEEAKAKAKARGIKSGFYLYSTTELVDECNRYYYVGSHEDAIRRKHVHHNSLYKTIILSYNSLTDNWIIVDKADRLDGNNRHTFDTKADFNR